MQNCLVVGFWSELWIMSLGVGSRAWQLCSFRGKMKIYACSCTCKIFIRNVFIFCVCLVTRIEARSERFDMFMHLDVNTEIYPIHVGQKFTMALATTLNLDGTPDSGYYTPVINLLVTPILIFLFQDNIFDYWSRCCLAAEFDWVWWWILINHMICVIVYKCVLMNLLVLHVYLR